MDNALLYVSDRIKHYEELRLLTSDKTLFKTYSKVILDLEKIIKVLTDGRA